MGQDRAYVVRFNPDRVTFPDTCPVCNKPAAAEGIVVASQGKEEEGFGSIRPSSITAPQHRASLIQSVSTRKLRIPTSFEHATSEGDNSTMRSVAAIINGLSIITFLIVSFNLGLTIMQGMPVAPWMAILWISLLITVLASYKALGPNGLQKAIDVVEYGGRGSRLTVKIFSVSYARQFLHSNADSVEIIEGGNRL
ncbi:MAG: hypothetical protein GF309_00360 [Candidatus Lokiarchaeota archaeon]|nr:hypothetical protein [Candidatus Lokiarchaeota archaeon]